jgi:hypothetical protein
MKVKDFEVHGSYVYLASIANDEVMLDDDRLFFGSKSVATEYMKDLATGAASVLAAQVGLEADQIEQRPWLHIRTGRWGVRLKRPADLDANKCRHILQLVAHRVLAQGTSTAPAEADDSALSQRGKDALAEFAETHLKRHGAKAVRTECEFLDMSGMVIQKFAGMHCKRKQNSEPVDDTIEGKYDGYRGSCRKLFVDANGVRMEIIWDDKKSGKQVIDFARHHGQVVLVDVVRWVKSSGVPVLTFKAIRLASVEPEAKH